MVKGRRHLRYDDRIKIEALVENGHSPREIADYMGVSLNTIKRELKRGHWTKETTDLQFVDSYSADIAQGMHDFKAQSKGRPLKIGKDHEYATALENEIVDGQWSPDSAINRLKKGDKTYETQICVKTLYNYISMGIFLRLTNEHLPRKKDKEKRPDRPAARVKRPLALSIEERPEAANNREEIGHWEMDTVIGKAKGGGPVLLVLTDRKSRKEILVKLREKKASEVVRALNILENQYQDKFPEMFKTITVDNGSEFMATEEMQKSQFSDQKRTTVYYCHPYSSWERGSNENQNGLIRRFIPKGTDIATVSDELIQFVQDWLNNLPRRIFGYKTANEIYASG